MQRCGPEDEVPVLKLPKPAVSSTEKDFLGTDTKLIDCRTAGKPASPVYTLFNLKKDVPLSSNAYLSDVAWLYGRTLFKCHQRETEVPLEDGDEVALDWDEQEIAGHGNIPS